MPRWLFFDDRVELRNESGDVAQLVDVGIQVVFNVSDSSFTVFPSGGQCQSYLSAVFDRCGAVHQSGVNESINYSGWIGATVADEHLTNTGQGERWIFTENAEHLSLRRR